MAIAARLEEARAARRAGDGPRCLQALREALAAAIANEPELVDTVAWRLAKAEHDYGTPAGVLDALDPLLARPDPFSEQPPQVRAIDRAMRHVQDHQGYGDPRTTRLWEAFSQHYRAQGDLGLAAHGDVQRAWWMACRGQLADLERLLDQYAALGPADFERSPHQHARAIDPSSTLDWIQMDLARTLLQAATWAGDERLAWEASEAYEDTMEDTALPRDGEFWFLDAQVRAALRFDWADVRRRYEAPWRDGVERGGGGAQTMIGRAEILRLDGHHSDALVAFDAAARSALAQHLGPEWAADAWLEASRTEGVQAESWRERVASAVDRYALDVFRPAIRG